MRQLTIPQWKQFIKLVAVERNKPVFGWGRPGGGKTEGTRQLADEEDYFFCDFRLGQYDSVDLRGTPAEGTDDDKGFTVWKPAVTLPLVGNPRFPTDRTILCVFDEFLQATNAVQGIMYQVVQERRLGEFPLLPNVRIVCLSNREGDRGIQNRMAKPLANRFTHVELVPDVEAVTDYWCDKLGFPPIVKAFFFWKKGHMDTFDANSPDKAFGSPRSNQTMIEYWMSDMPNDIKEAAMAGVSGDHIATDFWTFTEVWHRMIKPSVVIADPKGAPLPDETEPAMAYALAVNLAGHMNKKTVTAIHTYLLRMAPEFTTMAWQLATKENADLYSVPEYLDFSKRFKVVFER